MGRGVLVGIGAAFEVFPELAFLLVAGGPVVVVHHAHHSLREVSCAFEEVHLVALNKL